MKTKLFSIVILLFVMTFTSCSSDDDQPTIPVVPVADGFTWKENGTATVHTAASASFSTNFKTLIAKDASNATLFEINLSGTTPATYAVDASNAITYTGVSPYYTATGGSVIITTNAAGKMTGTFRSVGNSGGITAINGTFKNIAVTP